ncbi:ankyrin repeat domain-containing protein [Actinomadura fibrosa]|uniref:Ankyrin repeat domain-containing protein n=1 Tax=Actinomadura fibrosa TaxID=111802 RepID=A0ABW2XAN0_9ACTN|nr:ankyrin repeat domain-containing protein [Actinomadura fibrosa]
MSGSPPAQRLRTDLAMWRRARRYAVPRRMIERAAERRLAGDWRGACAAANVDVAFDLDGVADEFGAEAAARLSDDLRHFAPDLLRWHLPRVGGGRTTIATSLVLVLARYEPAGPGGRPLVLNVRTPELVTGSQRLTLALSRRLRDPRLSPRDWTASRHLFDARHSADLLRHTGGTDRPPFFHPDGTPLTGGELPASAPSSASQSALTEWAVLLLERGDLVGAFAAVGLDLRLVDDPKRPWWLRAPDDVIANLPVSPVLLAREVARHAAARPETGVVRIAADPRSSVRITVGGEGRGRPLAEVDGERGHDAPPLLDEHRWRRLPDLDLLRAGLVTPEELHPLVRSALFPARPGADGPVGPPEGAPPGPVRVRCLGEWHEVRSAGGRLRTPHTARERERENAMRALGGAVTGCFAVEHAWRTAAGRLPRALREQRSDLFERAQHGDTEGVLRLLDAGMDPRVRDGRRRTLLHCLHTLDHEVLLPRLLDAGLDLEDRDHHERTPLHVAVGDHGTAALCRALVDAGARTDVSDGSDLGLKDLIDLRRRTDLTWLA